MDEGAYEELTGHVLRPARENWKTLCPNHSERTPSFFIHKETYLSHCFGCGARGYLDNVLSKALEIPAAQIRQKLGIPTTSRFATGDSIETPTFEVAWMAGFPRIINHPYLVDRGFDDETVVAHEARWDKKYSRIVFPIRSLGGPVIGATGRAVTTEPEKKWFFYWTAKKGNVLYSIARPQVTPILVEGIFDAMYLYQVGYKNAISLLGASPSRYQISLIKDHYSEIILFLDNDEAGRIGQEMLARVLSTNTRVSYAVYPEGKKDPFELYPHEVERAIEGRQTYVQYTSTR